MDDICFDYYYGNEAEQYSYYRIPKALITDPVFKKLSTDAKLLYGLMLDRMSLSMKNNWMDDENRVYIFFTLEDAMEQLNCGSQKATKLFTELDSVNGIGLIERIRQGQGRPSIIYVKNFISSQKSRLLKIKNQDCGKSQVKTGDNHKSRLLKIETLDFRFSPSNKNDLNNLEKNNLNQSIIQSEKSENGLIDSIEEYRKKIKEGIAFDILGLRHDRGNLAEIVEIILEVMTTKRDAIKIGGEEYDTDYVKSRISKLDQFHIEYALECLKKNTTKIHNIKAYLLATLFNAPLTIGNYYQAEMQHDFHN